MKGERTFPSSELKISDIIRITIYLLKRKYRIVCLQFPDERLYRTESVVHDLLTSFCIVTEFFDKKQQIDELPFDNFKSEELYEVLGGISSHSLTNLDSKTIQFFILADNTFSKCCIDELGASRVNSDCVIHFGTSCFTRTSKLPSLLVFDQYPFHSDKCAQSLFLETQSSASKLIVLFDIAYSHAMPTLSKALKELASNSSFSPENLIFAEPPPEEMDPSSTSSIPDSSFGLTWHLPEGADIKDYSLVWIGEESPACVQFMLTYNSCKWLRYDPRTEEMVEDMKQMSSILRRRYYLVEKAKDANIVGIVVATLGAAGYTQAVSELRSLIGLSGRKSYTLLVGRPNPAKLANFPECEAFVVVACPHSVLMNSKEYATPVITPFEASLAFSKDKEWTGEYNLTFSSLQKGIISGSANSHCEEPEEDEEPRFSLIQGGYMSSSSNHRNVSFGEGNSERSVVVAPGMEITQKVPGEIYLPSMVEAGSGSEYFTHKRDYKGLETPPHLLEAMGKDSSAAKLPPGELVEGSFGRASEYLEEGSNQK